MSHQLRRLGFAFAAAFCLIAISAGYWGYAQQTDLLSRPDNPRRLLLERRFPRGAIVDRRGQVLAESVGPPGSLTRHYPYPDLAPVLGYVSPFFGTAGIEAVADATLHGDGGHSPLDLNWFSVLGAPPPGRAVQLSIDLAQQAAADEALGSRVGAVVLLDAASGEIRALASHPTYDANTLEADWEKLINDPEAPLLNRATLNLYQPGGALYPIVLANALRSGMVRPEEILPGATAAVPLSNLRLECLTPPPGEGVTVAQAFQHGCPQPFATMGDKLGIRALDQLFADFRLTEAPDIGIPALGANTTLQATDTALAGLGQSSLTMTPLHLALITAALARRGELPGPQLLLAEQDQAGQWVAVPRASHTIAAIAPETADQVKALMLEGYGAVALANAGGQRLAWYAGFAPFVDSRYTVAVLLENGDLDAAAQIGQALLVSALRP
jgi:peptidoglycan glycosyltransferase